MSVSHSGPASGVSTLAEGTGIETVPVVAAGTEGIIAGPGVQVVPVLADKSPRTPVSDVFMDVPAPAFDNTVRKTT